MIELNNNILGLSPYPIMDLNKKTYSEIIENHICLACDDKECTKNKKISDFMLYKCSKELLYLKITLNKKSYFLYGLTNNYKDLSRKEKKKYEHTKIYFKDLDLVKQWSLKTNNIFLKIEENILKTKLNLESNNSIFIHDIKKVYSTILRKMENYISKSCDTPHDYDTCVKNLDTNLLGVYKSISLLEHQFSIIDYVSNPEAILYGETQQIKIYKAVDKLVRIFHSISKNRIYIKGTSHNNLYLRQSFMTLMFILIDNANKYSLNDQEIIIEVQDYEDETNISVISYSPHMNNRSRKKIFEKYYRENYAKKITLDGQGIGLYLAKKIADSLKTIINVNCSDKKATINNIDYAEVTFSFKLKNID